MDNLKMDQRANIYNHQFRKPIHKKSIQTSETINDTLPALQQNKSIEKANVLRNQLNDTKSQIALMEAKIRNLQQIKEKNQQKNEQNMTKIQFINSVKERVRSDFEYKQRMKQKKQEQISMLKQQAEYLRQSLVSERRNAQNYMYTLKANEAEQERRRKKQHEYLIKKLKELDTIENTHKVEKVKEFHQTSASRLKDYQQSRVHFSKDNYVKKVATTLKQKERAKSLLQKLRQQEQKMLQEVRASEQVMLSSLYSLQSINPEHKKKRFNSSDKNCKYDIDDYSNEEFES